MLALLNDKSEKHDVLCSIINHDFVLEEDGDSGYGESPTLLYGSSVRTSKEQIPDLAPIENCWQPVKQTVRKFPYMRVGLM